MGSSWLKGKTLWFNQCARSPVDDDDGDYDGASRTGDTGASGGGRASVADIRTISSSDDSTEMSDSTARSPPPRPPSSSGGLRLFRSESRLSKVRPYVLSFLLSRVCLVVLDLLHNVAFCSRDFLRFQEFASFLIRKIKNKIYSRHWR